MSEQRKPVVGDMVFYREHLWTVHSVDEGKNRVNIIINGRAGDCVTVSWANIRYADGDDV